MGIQKFRFDKELDTCPNGTIPIVSEWVWGPTIAGVRNVRCPDGKTRTAYVQGPADTFFTIPAAIMMNGKTVRGSLTTDENGYEFHPYKYD